MTLDFTETALVIENPCARLSAEQFARLGEPFHRIEGHSEPGSGLGISIARRIASLHGLEITFRSLADGTRFQAVAQFVARPRRGPELQHAADAAALDVEAGVGGSRSNEHAASGARG